MGQGIFIATSRGWLGAFSAGGRGNLGIEVGRGRFQAFGEVPQAVLRLSRAHQFLSPSIARVLFEKDRPFIGMENAGDGFQNGPLSRSVGPRRLNNHVQAILYPNGGFGMPDLGRWSLKKQCSSRISSPMIR